MRINFTGKHSLGFLSSNENWLCKGVEFTVINYKTISLNCLIADICFLFPLRSNVSLSSDALKDVSQSKQSRSVDLNSLGWRRLRHKFVSHRTSLSTVAKERKITRRTLLFIINYRKQTLTLERINQILSQR